MNLSRSLSLLPLPPHRAEQSTPPSGSSHRSSPPRRVPRLPWVPGSTWFLPFPCVQIFATAVILN